MSLFTDIRQLQGQSTENIYVFWKVVRRKYRDTETILSIASSAVINS